MRALVISRKKFAVKNFPAVVEEMVDVVVVDQDAIISFGVTTALSLHE